MRIYAYGARPPVENAELVFEQLRLAHAYQCALVAIERRRRVVVDRLYQSACPAEWNAYEAATARVQEIIPRMRMTRTRPGDMLPPDMEMQVEEREIVKQIKADLAAAREAEQVARQAWYAAKKMATPRLRARLRMCDRGAYARAKRAYNLASAVGLAWGTRLKIAESVERAGKAAAKHGTLPHFPRFDGGGTIAVQIQGGLDAEAVFGGVDTRFRLNVVDAATWNALQGKSATQSVKKSGRVVDLPQPIEGSRRSTLRRGPIARLRIGSEGRQPIWAAWPVTLRRGLPLKALIKWVQIHARKIGSRTEWQLLVTVDDAKPAVHAEGPILAVNLGWRNLEDGGLRVGYAVGSDGREEEVRVPPRYTSGVAHVDSIRSIRDKLFEAVKEFLSDWSDESPRPPDWLVDATRHIDQWRSPARLVTLLREWERKRFVGDRKTWERLSAWKTKNAHLRFWECDERRKLLRMRLDFYRCLAARWASQYARVVVTDMDLRDFAKLPEPEEAADTEGQTQRRSRVLAAPSELRGAIKNACSTRGTGYEEKKAAWKTQTCNACGVVFAFAAKQDLLHICECGARWDQDANHCRNLLASGPVLHGAMGSLAPTGKQMESTDRPAVDGRWKKRRSRTTVEALKKTAKSA